MTAPTIPEFDNERDDPNEFTVVERPLLAQLVGMGWDYIQGDLEYPAKTFRASFRETVLEPRLKAAVRRINKDAHGNEWLDDLTIDRAVRELLKPDGRGLLELNRNFTQRLQTGVRVTVAEGPRAGQDITVHFIAWEKDRLSENEFLAINQFQVLIKGTPYNKRPDVVLFVNGLPLVVIECKSPAVTNPMEAAVDQLLHYSNQRELDHAEREGIPELFHFNALVIGSHFSSGVRQHPRRYRRVFRRMEGHQPDCRGRRASRSRQGGRPAVEPGKTGRGHVAPRAPARLDAQLHCLGFGRRAAGQEGCPLSAVPRRSCHGASA